MKLFDTHAHILDARFDADRDEVLKRCREVGVERIMEGCCDEAEIDAVLALAEKEEMVVGSVGVHPHAAREMTNATLDKMEQALAHPKILAVGEIGLDYHYDFSPRDVQRHWLGQQLALAAQKNVPVILHNRESSGDMLEILTAHKNGLRGVMHSFSGSYETAARCLDLGLYIGLGGPLTFGNAVKPRELAARLPIDRLVIETDCPYLTPVPFRGKRNDPSLLPYILTALAQCRRMDEQELAEQLFANSLALFQLI
ncbi:MAG: TatD family hydrolase [Clostridiales bacterium]|nr:TatD family hydrolase [Clostridiales bacterium]